MEIFQKLYRRINRLVIYVYSFVYAFITRRRIVVREAGTYGQEGFWQTSFQVDLRTASQQLNLEVLRAAPEDSKFYKVATAIRLAEEIARDEHLPPTVVFIHVDKDVIVITVRK